MTRWLGHPFNIAKIRTSASPRIEIKANIFSLLSDIYVVHFLRKIRTEFVAVAGDNTSMHTGAGRGIFRLAFRLLSLFVKPGAKHPNLAETYASPAGVTISCLLRRARSSSAHWASARTRPQKLPAALNPSICDLTSSGIAIRVRVRSFGHPGNGPVRLKLRRSPGVNVKVQILLPTPARPSSG